MKINSINASENEKIEKNSSSSSLLPSPGSGQSSSISINITNNYFKNNPKINKNKKQIIDEEKDLIKKEEDLKNNLDNNNELITNKINNLSPQQSSSSSSNNNLLFLQLPPSLPNQSKSLPSSLISSPSSFILQVSSSSSFNSFSNSSSSTPLPSPSSSNNNNNNMSAATFLSNWRRLSNKTKNNNNLNENNNNLSTNIKINNNGGYSTLSELSHDVLAQIIRLFPFSTSLTSSPSSSTPTSCSNNSNSSTSSPFQRHIIYRALSQPNPTINTKCNNLIKNEEEEKNEKINQFSSSEGKNNLKEEILNNKLSSSKKHLLRDWHIRASSSSFGRRLKRAASTFSGSKIGGISSKERPKNLSIFGKLEKNCEKNAKSPTTCNGALSRLCKVSVDTMAITALPLDCWLKERLKNWVQLSGHQGTIVPASNHSLWKKQPQGSHIESRAYSQIMLDPTLKGITPNFIREIQHRNEVFIEIQDLLAEFPDPSTRAIMDIKIGTRTFLESEVANNRRRTDLYRKMIELAPDEPNEEERQYEAITKLRYMQFRERKSSSASLGFRIEASQLPGVPIQKNFKQVRTRTQVRSALWHFCGSDKVCEQMAKRLRHIRDSVEASCFFATHEIVGSSVLLIHDGDNNNNNKQIKVGAWLIDFAKCHRVEGGRKLTHRLQWDLGNHEDGYLIGLDNLVNLLEEKEEENVEENNRNNENIKNEDNNLKFNNEQKFIEMLGNI